MPSDRTPADREPAPDHEGQGAGSVVVGLDPSSPAGIVFTRVHVDTELLAERLDTVAHSFYLVRENVSRMAPVVQQTGREISRSLANMRVAQPMPEYDADDAMHWSPPADGEETPPCPA